MRRHSQRTCRSYRIQTVWARTQVSLDEDTIKVIPIRCPSPGYLLALDLRARLSIWSKDFQFPADTLYHASHATVI